MTKYLTSYLLVLVIFTVIDMVWLMGVARSTYVAEMGGLMKKSPNLVAAVIFYLLYAGGLAFFAVKPGFENGSWLLAAGMGAGLGLIAYGTYDFTNLAVIEGYGWRIALIDLVWGTTVSAVTAAIATKLVSAFA
ncbi:MAG: DUF2177 family protein [Aestuariivirga sp.]